MILLPRSAPVPFFPEVHEELTKSWMAPFMARSGAPRIPARPQVIQEVDEAALTRATRRCWNLLFLRRRREEEGRAENPMFLFVSIPSHFLKERAISFSSGFSGPWDHSVRRPASSLFHTYVFLSFTTCIIIMGVSMVQNWF